MSSCRLCHLDKTLLNSHIIPHAFSRRFVNNSITGKLRKAENPNLAVQDVGTRKLLCRDCEELFSKYETKFSNQFFSNNSSSHSIDLDTDTSYLFLSIAWRTLVTYLDDIPQMVAGGYGTADLTDRERERLKQVEDRWRSHLLNEDMDAIADIDQFLFPFTISDLQDQCNIQIKRCLGSDCLVYGDPDSFERAVIFFYTPDFLAVTPVWGTLYGADNWRHGSSASFKTEQLPADVIAILNKIHGSMFEEADSKLSDTQRKKTEQRVYSAMRKKQCT